QYARSNIVPSRTNRSKFGVLISGLKAPIVLKCCWSLVINKTFGFLIHNHLFILSADWLRHTPHIKQHHYATAPTRALSTACKPASLSYHTFLVYLLKTLLLAP